MHESETSADPPTTQKCERCGAPIEDHPNYPRICDECCSIYGSCCNEWEDQDSATN